MRKIIIILIVLLIILGVFYFTQCRHSEDLPDNSGQTEETNNLSETNQEILADSGTYVGQIDNNSIEIKISGVPEEKAAKAFRFTDDSKAIFDGLELQEGDKVKFQYYINEDEQNILVNIEKI